MANDSGLRKKRLRTAGSVIDALGGTTVCARRLGKSVQQISNARGSNKMPPSTVLVAREALAEVGCVAPARLWGVAEPRSRSN